MGNQWLAQRIFRISSTPGWNVRLVTTMLAPLENQSVTRLVIRLNDVNPVTIRKQTCLRNGLPSNVLAMGSAWNAMYKMQPIRPVVELAIYLSYPM